MSSPPFRVVSEVEPTGRVVVVAPVGKLEAIDVDGFEAEIDRLYGEGQRRFLFDMTGLTFVGSVGLRVFMRLASKVRGDGDARMFGLTPNVREVFEITKLTTVLRAYATRADALDAMRSA